MKIGYACLTLGVPDTSIKGLTLKNASAEKLSEIIKHNLLSLEKIIDYNFQNGIQMFRISSDIIPFGSSPVNQLQWHEDHRAQLAIIAHKIEKYAMRISMHPGQYTVLNSPHPEVAEKAVADLDYHTKFLESIGTDAGAKIILHVGGVYGNKKEAINRFVKNFKALGERISSRIVIENDDKLYNIGEVIEISRKIDTPVVYDNLHNEANCFDRDKTDAYWVFECSKTWKAADGTQEIHYSQQDLSKRPGAHSASIAINAFINFSDSVKEISPDIMLEVKDKNVSAIKCANYINPNGKINLLEREWGRYKYAVLERSAEKYNEIRALLKDKTAYPVTEFYRLIESAMQKEPVKGTILNAAFHVFGHFNGEVTAKEKRLFEQYTQGETVHAARVKKLLFSIAQRRLDKYLLESLYFYYN